MAKLGEAISFDKKNYIEIQDEVEYRISGVQSYGNGIVIRRTVKGSELTMKKYQVIKKNQLMWCKVDTKNGAFGVTHDEHIGSLASTNMALAEINEEKYLPQFIETLFQSKPFYDWITKYSSGSTNRKYLTPKELMEQIEIPNLSRSQQELFQSKINFLKSCGFYSGLTHQQTLLKKLRQQILQEAIEGKLTADWREQNPDVEPANELLARIQAEKEQLIKNKKIKKQKPLPAISEAEKPFDLPEGWVWCPLTNCTINKDEFRVPITKSDRNRREKIYDYYGASGVIDKIDHYTHQGRHLLIGEDGANLVARSTPIAFFANGKFWVNNHAHVLDTIDSSTLDYLRVHINAIDLNPYLSGGFQPKLSQQNLNQIKIALPPLPEQKAIVSKVEKLLALCDQLETQITENQTHAEQLMQAVLKEAFIHGNESSEKVLANA